MRGDIQFMLSIIYSAVIVLAIFLIVQAFFGVTTPRQAGFKHLDEIDRVFETGYSEAVFVSLQENEKIFLGFVENEGCKEKFGQVIPGGERDEISEALCGSDLCYCYSFHREGTPYQLCKRRSITEVSIEGGDAVRDGDRGVCLVAEKGLYSFIVSDPGRDEDGRPQPRLVSLRPATEGGS